MPAQITNTASLTFEYGNEKGFAASNIAVTTLQETLNISISALAKTYTPGENITFIINIKNNSEIFAKNLKVTDNLGAFKTESNLTVTPLSYVGPSHLYVGGNFNGEIEAKLCLNKIIFNIPQIPPMSNAIIIYKAKINEFAPLEKNSSIKATAELSGRILCASISASETLTISNVADIKITKTMSPNPVLCGGKLTYAFILQNSGNVEALNVVLTDKFSPAPTSVSVTLNGEDIPTYNYTYLADTLTLPSVGSELIISIPAAEFLRDQYTGKITVNPSVVNISVIGNI